MLLNETRSSESLFFHWYDLEQRAKARLGTMEWNTLSRQAQQLERVLVDRIVAQGMASNEFFSVGETFLVTIVGRHLNVVRLIPLRNVPARLNRDDVPMRDAPIPVAASNGHG